MSLRRLACAVLAAAVSAPAPAHRLDEYLQSATIRVAPDGVTIHLRLVPGVEVSERIWAVIDTDRSGELSAAEQQAYARRVAGDLALNVDGRETMLDVESMSFPSHADTVKGVGQISLGLHARLDLAGGDHRLQFVSNHRPASSVYLVNTLLPAEGGIDISGQQRSPDQTRYELRFRLRPAGPVAPDCQASVSCPSTTRARPSGLPSRSASGSSSAGTSW
jgi:hypothetical protein